MKSSLTHDDGYGDDDTSSPDDSLGDCGDGDGSGSGYSDGSGHGDGDNSGTGDGGGFGDGDDDHLPLGMICTMVDGLAEQMVNVLCASLITR